MHGKGKLGPVPIRIYAFRLSDSILGDLSDFTISGKSGKYSLKFKRGAVKFSFKNGKKDSFGKPVELDYNKDKKRSDRVQQ